MKQISSVLIAGSGAIGSMVAYQVFKTLPSSLSVLAGGERLDRYRAHPFEINGEFCRFPLTDAEVPSSQDLIIIACKYHQLGQIMKDLRGHIGRETIILSLLNGITSEKIIAEQYPEARVPYAMIVGTDAGHEGRRTTFSKTGTIFFGDAQNTGNKTEHVLAIARFFDKTGIAYTIPENMLNRLWFKFMMNVGINQVTAILRRPYKIFKKETLIAEAASLMDEAMREVITIAKAEGIVLGEEDISAVYRILDGLSDEGKTSMCQDVESERKTEVELFSGAVLELGKKHDIRVPVNRVMHQMLVSIERSYTNAGGPQ